MMNSPVACNHAVQRLPPASADLATAWAFLEEAIDHIMTRPQTAISYSEFMGLYTVAYHDCTSSRTHSGSVASNSGLDRGNHRGPCSDLYNNLIRYFVTHLEGLREQSDLLQDETLPRYYAGEWARYTSGANYVNPLFVRLNRVWVKRERDRGRKTIYPVYILALVLWKTNFCSHMQSDLTGAILRLVERQRNGETIDQNLVKKVVDSFVSLGLDNTDINKTSLDFYREHLEIPFLGATEKYYEQESKVFLVENSISDYLKKVQERLQEEEDRADRYLNAETREQLISKCEHVLIRRHAQLMWESFQTLLDHDRDDDLQRMYALLSRIPEGLEPLRKRFEEHVKKAGQTAISKLVGEGTDGLVSSTAYMNALLDVQLKNSVTVSRCFKGDAMFVTSFDKACRELMNRNVATGTSATESPELISRFEFGARIIRKTTTE